MNRKHSIAVILSGCGNRDGAEIHESTLTLLAIHKLGAEYQCYAPNIVQHHVLNFITGAEMPEQRNVLIESARIARGNIKDLCEFDATNHDAIILPGGLGAVKNLSNFAFEGADCSVHPELITALTAMKVMNKPIGALCIAPVLIARIFDNVTVTVGQDLAVIRKVEEMGAQHKTTNHGEIIVDKENRIVTTPCYMLDARVDQIADGAERLVVEILNMISTK